MLWYEIPHYIYNLPIQKYLRYKVFVLSIARWKFLKVFIKVFVWKFSLRKLCIPRYRSNFSALCIILRNFEKKFHQILHNYFQSKLIEIYILLGPKRKLFWMKGQMNTLYYFQSEMSLESMLRVHLQFLKSWKLVFFFILGMFYAEMLISIVNGKISAKSRVKWPKMFRIGTKIIVSPT